MSQPTQQPSSSPVVLSQHRLTVSRRDALKLAASSIGLAALGQPVANAALADDAGWIDAHVHVWTPDIKKYPLDRKYKVADMAPASFTPEELWAQAKPCSVERIVLIQMSFYGYDNQYMLDCMRAYPGKFGGVAIVDEQQPTVAATMKQLAQQGVRGFRLYTTKAKAEAWAASPGIAKMWATGADEGLAMCLLADPDALPAIDQMCAKYPKTPVVIDHFARIGLKGTIVASELEQLCRLAKYPRLTVKTSAFYALGQKRSPYTDLLPMIRQLRDAFGAERLMWATDCPYQVQEQHTYADSIALLRDRADFLSADERKAILRGTAERVFFR